MISSDLVEVIKAVTIDPEALTADVNGEQAKGESASGLSAHLGSILYARFHAGAVDRGTSVAPRNTRDLAAEEKIANHTPHTETVIPAYIAGDVIDGTHIAVINKVRVRIRQEKIIERDGPMAKIRFPALRPALSPGFFFVNSSREPTDSVGLLRVYLHCTTFDDALSVWKTVISLLEDQGAVYRAKMLSNPVAYPRRDAIVVYLPPESWQHAKQLADTASRLHLARDTSPIAHRVAEGMAVAWEPDDDRPRMQGLSFGQHRMAIVASTLVQHAIEGGDDPQRAVYETLIDSAIDPMNPARNLSSPPIVELGLV